VQEFKKKRIEKLVTNSWISSDQINKQKERQKISDAQI
jgi:hypothetical protein